MITNDAPAFLPVGPLDIHFFARDFAGNMTVRQSTLVVLPDGRVPAGRNATEPATPGASLQGHVVDVGRRSAEATPEHVFSRSEWSA